MYDSKRVVVFFREHFAEARIMPIEGLNSSFFDCEDQQGIAVVAVHRQRLSEEENLELFGQELTSLTEQFGFLRVIVDLTRVDYLTSAALGKLIQLHRKLNRKNGCLHVCGVRGMVHEVLKTSRLNEYFHIVADVKSAIQALEAKFPS